MYICFMISVVDTYNTLVEYCNKDQKGFVTPKVFNTFAGLAQKKIYNSFFSAVATAKGVRLNQTDGAKEFSADKYIKEDLSRYVRTVHLEPDLYNQDTEDYQYGREPYFRSLQILYSNTFYKPKDLGRIISIGTARGIDCEIVYNVDDTQKILRSNLSKPTWNFPLARVGKEIEVWPGASNASSYRHISITYYRQPRSVYAIDVNGFSAGDCDYESEPNYAELAENVPDFVNIRDFDLPEHYKDELVETIAQYIGIRLRDQVLTNKPQD